MEAAASASNRLDKIEEKVDEMDSKLNKIYERLVGNELSTGFLGEFAEIKKEMTTLKEFKNRVLWTVASCMAISGVVGFLANIIFKYLTGK